MSKNVLFQNVITNPDLASHKSSTNIYISGTTKVIEDERFETWLSVSYTVGNKQSDAFIWRFTFVWTEVERSQICSFKTFLALPLCCLWQYSYDCIYINIYFYFRLLPLPSKCVLQIFMPGNCFSRLLKIVRFWLKIRLIVTFWKPCLLLKN